MKYLFLITLICSYVVVVYSQQEEERIKCLTMEARAGSKESRVLKRVEQIIRHYHLAKDDFFMGIKYGENGDTVLHISNCIDDFDFSEKENRCGMIKAGKKSIIIVDSVDKVRSFLKLDYQDTTEVIDFTSDDYDGCHVRKVIKNKVIKNLDIFIYKSYNNAYFKPGYFVEPLYDKCKMPSEGFFRRHFNVSPVKRKRHCNYRI